ncbi:MAG: phosphatidylserine decarboxylase [candidate division NC10 bacterium RIFCSPLOWO2_12_FULL_66_18]|nr:MAG: phosphatidylserine decarboxylase [candidate division NC10 bacterium RIFCSPLOWO2_02_FULL_66_22]OGB99642.1 MAG: phosphatidylserine decarboxylase [candidate division NC10 bacterium RIFCSPLOWO2_12_FULL_66_18]
MSNFSSGQSFRLPIERDGLVFILPTLGVSGLLFGLHFPGTGTGILLLAAFLVYFFRDPERAIPQGERLILAPADGRIVAIKPFPDWKGPFGEPLTRVSIFLSVLDVHVNRAPLTSMVNAVTHSPGRFVAAWGEAASAENEQTLIHFASPDGDVWVKQIAGLLARRIVCRVKPGQKVAAGDRIGLIRFGSRVDCILPATAELKVRRGQAVKGGSTILGVIP